MANHQRAVELLDEIHTNLSFYSGSGLGGAAISIHNVRAAAIELKRAIARNDADQIQSALTHLESSLMGLTLVESGVVSLTVDGGSMLQMQPDEALKIIDNIRDSLGVE